MTEAKPETRPVPVPEPLVGPGPLPMGVAVMRCQKQRYRDWLAAGGTPAIYT